MFLRLVLFCLCLWRLDGVFGDVEVKILVKEGDSVTLDTGLTEMKDGDEIQWWFGNENTLIAEINVTADRFTVYDDVLDGRFRDRLKLDNQTGSLIITNTRTEHTGDYKLQISHQMSKNFFVGVLGVFGDDEVKSVSLNKGDSVTLNSGLTEVKDEDEIWWRFENTLIAEINKRADRITVYDDVLDGRFRDRLKLDNQTGSLTITNIRTERGGVYKLQINGVKSLKTFRVSVSDEVKSVSVKEGDSVTLNSDLTEIDDLILWTFGPNNSLIAKLNRKLREIFLYNGPDGRFRERLNLDHQTGSLTITNTRTEHAGLYEVTISRNREIRFNVSVSGI